MDTLLERDQKAVARLGLFFFSGRASIRAALLGKGKATERRKTGPKGNG